MFTYDRKKKPGTIPTQQTTSLSKPKQKSWFSSSWSDDDSLFSSSFAEQDNGRGFFSSDPANFMGNKSFHSLSSRQSSLKPQATPAMSHPPQGKALKGLMTSPQPVQRLANPNVRLDELRQKPTRVDTYNIQRKEAAGAMDPSHDVLNRFHQIAAQGVQGPGQKLPHFDKVQAAFGQHDLSQVQAYTGSQAARAAQAMGAKAYATGHKIAFSSPNPDLHTVAHEAAHVIQQQVGVRLKENIGQVNDEYERHADAVAHRVLHHQSAESLLSFQANKPSATASSTFFAPSIKASSYHTAVQMMKFDKTGKQVKEGEESSVAYYTGSLSFPDQLRTLDRTVLRNMSSALEAKSIRLTHENAALDDINAIFFPSHDQKLPLDEQSDIDFDRKKKEAEAEDEKTILAENERSDTRLDRKRKEAEAEQQEIFPESELESNVKKQKIEETPGSLADQILSSDANKHQYETVDQFIKRTGKTALYRTVRTIPGKRMKGPEDKRTPVELKPELNLGITTKWVKLQQIAKDGLPSDFKLVPPIEWTKLTPQWQVSGEYLTQYISTSSSPEGALMNTVKSWNAGQDRSNAPVRALEHWDPVIKIDLNMLKELENIKIYDMAGNYIEWRKDSAVTASIEANAQTDKEVLINGVIPRNALSLEIVLPGDMAVKALNTKGLDLKELSEKLWLTKSTNKNLAENILKALLAEEKLDPKTALREMHKMQKEKSPPSEHLIEILNRLLGKKETMEQLEKISMLGNFYTMYM